MANIVNQTFFVGDIALPNLQNSAELNFLEEQIKKYEPECLLKILGYPLYKLFGSESSQRMTDLLSGAEYYDGQNELRKWQGIVHSTNISLLANYVYFFHQQKKAMHTTGVSTSVQKTESGNSVSPRRLMANAWNFFSSEVEDMMYFLWLKKDYNSIRVYPEFTYHQFLETKRISRFIDPYFSF